MKKNWLLCLLVMVGTSVLVTSCSKDGEPTEKPSVEITWKDALGTYNSDESHKLTINGKADEVPASKTVKLAAGTGDKAKITLNNIVPDKPVIDIDNVTITKKDDQTYEFAGEVSVGETTVSVSGSLKGLTESSSLELNVARKINSPLAGTWNLAFTEAGGKVALTVDTGDEDVDQMLQSEVGTLLAGLLAQKVTGVTVSLGEDGKFDVQWTTKSGSNEPIGMPDGIREMVSIDYFVSDGKLYLAIDKALLPLLTALIPQTKDTADPAPIPTLINSILEDKGDFVALPVSFRDTESGTEFYVQKDLLGAVAPILLPMLGGNLPEGIPDFVAGLLPTLPELIAGSKSFDVGLGFNR
jgi:hypothetical protein